MGVNPFARAIRQGDVVVIHQTDGGPSVRGAMIRRTRRHWILERHSIEMDGALIESKHQRVLVPVVNVSLVEASSR